MGLKYLGPVDGHDVEAMEAALRRARRFGGPVRGALRHREGPRLRPGRVRRAGPDARYRRTDPVTGGAIRSTDTDLDLGVRRGAGRVGAERAGRGGHHRGDAGPHRAGPFAREFPDRVFDVGIAEQHAVTSAAGLAMGGLHPVVAIYATFLNRAFDQLLMDVALHRLPVTFVLDRAGVTGDDGP